MPGAATWRRAVTGRPRTGSVRQRGGRWEASRSDLTTGRRRTRSFPTEAEAYA